MFKEGFTVVPFWIGLGVLCVLLSLEVVCRYWHRMGYLKSTIKLGNVYWKTGICLSFIFYSRTKVLYNRII